MAPGVLSRDVGKGRSIYFASWSNNYAFHRLTRRAIFWAARAEERFDALDLTGIDRLKPINEAQLLPVHLPEVEFRGNAPSSPAGNE